MNKICLIDIDVVFLRLLFAFLLFNIHHLFWSVQSKSSTSLIRCIMLIPVTIICVIIEGVVNVQTLCSLGSLHWFVSKFLSSVALPCLTSKDRRSGQGRQRFWVHLLERPQVQRICVLSCIVPLLTRAHAPVFDSYHKVSDPLLLSSSPAECGDGN